jgi:type IV pilus assembly protein PilW
MNMTQRSFSTYRLQQGLTLVELMVALVLSLMLLAGGVQIYVSSKKAYQSEDGIARLQESLRFGLEFLEMDIRKAGYGGCIGSIPVANSLNGTVSGWSLSLNDAVMGYNGNADGSTSEYPTYMQSDVIDGTDAIEITFGDPGSGYIVEKHNANAASIHLTEKHDLKQGEILIITDCQTAGIFQQSNTNNNNTVAVTDHNTGNATTPGNCTKFLGGAPVDCSNQPGFQKKSFEDGGMILRFQASSFFIGTGSSGRPALFRGAINNASGTVTIVPQEIVEGIADMQITYGVDTDASKDGTPNTYLTADTVTSNSWWDDVVSVRLNLLMETERDNLADTKQTYTFNGATVTAGDNRIRKAMTTTVALRNRLP